MSAETDYKAIPSTLITDSTVAGRSFLTLANPGAITFPRINADNTVTARSAANFRADIGAGTGSGDALVANPLSQFAATTSAQLAGVISDGTGESSGLLVFSNGPTITSPIIANIAPAANITLTQNSVAVLTSVFTGALVNTLYLSLGSVGIGTASPISTGGRYLTISNAGTVGLYWQDSSVAANNRNWNFVCAGTIMYFQAVNDAINSSTNAIELHRSGSTVTKVVVPNATASTSTITGAFIVGGGVGIAGALYTGGIHVNGAQMRLKAYTVATLPAGTAGDSAYVTDALGPTYLVTVVGGGAVITTVFYNGTNWVCN